MVKTKLEKKEYQSKWYIKNREKIKNRSKVYYNIHRKESIYKNKKWRENHPQKTKLFRTENQKRYIKKYPDKVRAHRIANKKIKITEGFLCEICKKEKAKHKHHPDYSKPLEVVLVCIKCHNKLHNEGN